jgi:hypothetical protein
VGKAPRANDGPSSPRPFWWQRPPDRVRRLVLDGECARQSWISAMVAGEPLTRAVAGFLPPMPDSQPDSALLHYFGDATVGVVTSTATLTTNNVALEATMRMEVRRSAVESGPLMWSKPSMAAASSVVTLLEVSFCLPPRRYFENPRSGSLGWTMAPLLVYLSSLPLWESS